MSLDVVILNWNNVDDTIRCIREVTRWQRIGPTIWVVDNGSSDDSVPRLQQCPDIRLLRSRHNLGFAGGNNLAIRRALAEGEVECFLLLNNDAALEEKGALRLLDTLHHSQAGVVGPILRDPPPDARLQAAGGLSLLWRINTHMDYIPDSSTPYAVDYVPGTAILVAAEVFERVGLLDEAYFFSGEIADLCLRAQRAGYPTLVDPAVTVHHDTARSAELRATLYAYYSLRNRFLFVRKFYPSWLVPLYIYWSLFSLFSIGKARLLGKSQQASALALALRHGLSARFGDQSPTTYALANEEE